MEMLAKMVANQAGMKTMQQKMDSNLREIIEDMRIWRKEMKAGQEMTETCLECKAPASEEMESGAEHREVPKEHATVNHV
jgi:hypothetical protein